jgi:hypothetical protein
MAAEPLPAPADPLRALRPDLDVVPLLRSYRDAMRLARTPPASLRLWRPLQWIHMRLRPRWACCYFTTRYVRGRVDALERALARRTALGEADANDNEEAQAVARFKASLPPAPSRIWGVAGLTAAILLIQVLVSGLLASSDGEQAQKIKDALGALGTSPDVKQFSDIGGVLVAANYFELLKILIGIAGALYLFGRPLASGYRLSYLCLGRAERFGLLRRHSALCQAAAGLQTGPQEQAAVRTASAEFHREMPIDLLVKTLPGLLMAYLLIGAARGEGSFQDVTHLQVAAWTIASIAIGGAGAWVLDRLRHHRRPWRLTTHAGCAAALVGVSVAIAGVHALTHGDGIWFAFAAAVLARFGWLTLQARSRRYPVWWVVIPLVLTSVLALAARLPPDF